MDMIDILRAAVKQGASDVHLLIGRPPFVRRNGEVMELNGFAAVTAEESKRLVYSLLYDEQKQRFEQDLELDCSVAIPGLARFRVNVLLQMNGIECVIRVVSSKIPTADEIKLPPTVVEFANLPRGLVLVTGATGAGKSTTLACLIELINDARRQHILTVEDPIEFVYESKRCILRQREVGASTRGFGQALKHALRQDPDVILIGEMRDLETISLALTAAETGHLCFATLHTTDAAQTVDRIIDVFPPHQQQQVRVQLSTVLKGVVCQTLLPTSDGTGRVAAREIMVVTPAIANLIRENKTHMIYQAIETGSKFGMIPLDRALADYVNDGTVSFDDAVAKSSDPDKLREMTGRSSGGSRSSRSAVY
ncbi:MAG: type IV pilus twitching motility protein PilT [Elusimicrobia bacterium]|mgnify:CR=1 FL=1|jgi:twitching motility protein PilT|nr:type IV pilus twitching motility protein PilT [Elusimicrobiota bacterium]MBK7206816.1 type IV pilus twitching motility protein PilT [Elusimicrobiota bacterium]MBK7545614.1 type IV pilus twitching motility protein PilT [Elusimicrobiota bacterium]MBK7575196.1 type IV pilus twitching motility protein PilT [Elusimicrobiota bacterium]MBK7687837.1 type IV pilus twitching motility protein PilT [Elusimicrobiota bacterium]